MTSIRTTITALLVTLLMACSSATSVPDIASPGVNTETQRPLLNSERIRQQFGSYGIEVVQQDDRLRVSNLYSLEAGAWITRTLAVVFFPETIPAPLRAEHDAIRNGQSIGEEFKKSGWKVEKQNLYVGELAAASEFADVYAAMGEIAAVDLAVHIYQLSVSRDGNRYPYATIAEIHHPDYLDLTELEAIYSAGNTAPGLTQEDVDELLAGVVEVMQRY
jgi:hypothetical protein